MTNCQHLDLQSFSDHSGGHRIQVSKDFLLIAILDFDGFTIHDRLLKHYYIVLNLIFPWFMNEWNQRRPVPI